MSCEPKDTTSNKPAGKPDGGSAADPTPGNGDMQDSKDTDADRLNDDISAFYDDLANEPMPDRLRDLLKTLGDKNGKK